MRFKSINPRHMEAFLYTHLQTELPYPIVHWHRELMALTRFNRLAIAAPRSFAKSTYYSFFYALYLVLERPGISIQLISATGALAEKWLARIKHHIEFTQSIRDFYGDQVGDKWSNEEIHLKNGSVIMAKGAGKQIRGFRPDVVIADDLETNEIVSSKDQLDKLKKWFWTDLMGMVLADSQVIIVGTILHPESFLMDLIQYERDGWTSRLYQAVDDAWTIPLWEAQWSIEKLKKRRAEIGTAAFNQEYMNNPIPDHLRTFQEKWFKYFDKEPEGCVYFTTIDPAIETGELNDFTAIVTCAVDNKENIYVVEYINKRLLPSETVDAVFDAYTRWRSATIGIEVQGFQKMLKFDLDREKRRRRDYPIIVELKSEGKRKGLRIEALQPWFESGKVFIKKDQEELKMQLLRFPSPNCHDDIIDALAYQLNIIRPALGKATIQNPDSFDAHMERMRSKIRQGQQGVWGNQALRKYR